MRLIDKDRLISILEAKSDMAVGEPKKYFAHVANMVGLLPEVDAVPVVRCKDCAYWQKESTCCCFIGRSNIENWYCAIGVRKEDE